MPVIETEHSDEELVRSAQTGNMQGFDKLIERYFGIVCAIAYSRLGNREATEDLAQEVFLRTYLYLDNFQEPYKFAGWLVRITHNLATDWVRQRRRASKLCQMVSMDQMGEEVPDRNGKNAREKMNLQEQNKALLDAIFQLPTEQREVVLLHYSEGLSQKEIARCLGVHPSTIGRHLNRALAAMKGCLEPILRESAPSLRATKNAVIRTTALVGALAGMSAGAKSAIAAAAGGTAWFSSVLASAGGSTAASKVIPSIIRTISTIITKEVKLMIAKKVMVTAAIITGLITVGVLLYVSNNRRTERSANQEDSVPTAVKHEKQESIESKGEKEEEPTLTTGQDKQDVTAAEAEEQILTVTEPRAVIAGKVVDAGDQPVTNATVTLFQQPTFEFELDVDEEGRFRSSSLASGKYWLRATADGFLPMRYRLVGTGQEDLLLRLESGCPIEGTVVFADSGEPVCVADVKGWAMRSGELRPAMTDTEGNFRIVTYPNEETRLRAFWEHYVTDKATTVHCDEGGEVSGIILKLTEGGSVSGTVREKETGEPVEGIAIDAHSGMRMRRSIETRSDTEGRFRITGLMPGKIPLWISSDDYELSGKSLYHYVDVALGKETTGQELLLVRKTINAIYGEVVDVDENAVSGARIALFIQQDPYLRSRHTLTSGIDGTFFLNESCERAVTGLQVTHADYAPKFIALGENGASGDSRYLRIVLEKGGSIEGFVLDVKENPKPQSMVSLINSSKRAARTPYLSEVKSARTDESGHYLLAGVPEGKYRVRTSIKERNVESAVFSIGPDEKLSDINLIVDMGGHIAGRVTDEEGSPVKWVVMSITDTTTESFVDGTETDSEGHYKFEDLVEGRNYGIKLWGGESLNYHQFRDASREVLCSADDVDFVITIPEFGSISGFVYRRSDKSPVEKFNLSLGHRRYYDKVYESEDGSFSCTDLSPGKYYVRISAPGFADFRSKAIEVKPNDDTTLDIYLEEGGTISGCVYRKSDWTPVEKFYLSLLSKPDPYEERVSTGYYHKEFESDDGSFSCTDVLPGKYSIKIVAEGLPDFETERFEVTPNDETIQDIYISEGGTIRGRVVNESEHGVPEAVVKVKHLPTYTEKTFQRKATTDKIGGFVLSNLTPGRVTLTANHPDYAELEVRDIVVTEDEVADDIVLKLEKGTLVHGWVKDLDGEKKRGVEISLQNSSSGYHATTQSDNQGEYRFERVPSGTCCLHPQYMDALLSSFELDGEEEKEVNIDFTETGTISGDLNLFSPPESATFFIYVYRYDDKKPWRLGRQHRQIEPEEDNSFKIEGLFPGKYQLTLTGYRKKDDGTSAYLKLTTSPKHIVVNISPKEKLIKDITVIEISEPSKKD